jgi:hypothetical protein
VFGTVWPRHYLAGQALTNEPRATGVSALYLLGLAQWTPARNASEIPPVATDAIPENELDPRRIAAAMGNEEQGGSRR